MDGRAMAGALLSSLNALVAVAAPNRVVPVLRHALTTLLAEEPTSGHKPSSKKNRTRWVGDIATWAPVRDKVLATLSARGMSRRALAAELGIAHATLKPSLSPRGPVPSRANIARLQAWLESTEVREDGAARNGHAPEATAPPRPTELPRRLSLEQREHLAGHAELDGRTLCKTIGINEDGIGIAVAGGDVSGEAFDRLTSFLQQQQSTAT